MKISRREFIHSGCAAAAVSLSPSAFDKAEAGFRLHGSVQAASGFSGGKSQGQSWDMSFAAQEFPFINLMKTAPAWNFADNSTQAGPNDLDANGYPLTISHSGVSTLVNNYPQTSSKNSGVYVLTWLGNGSLGNGIFGYDAAGNGFNTTPNTGYTTANLTSTTGSGRYEFTCPSNMVTMGIGISALSTPTISNIQLFAKVDETALNAGQIFTSDFLNVVKSGKFGVWRFLDWPQANSSNCTTWASRKPTTYYSYEAFEWRSAYNAGTPTVSSNKMAVTFGSGAPTSQQIIHITPPSIPITVSIGANAIVTWGGSSPQAHGFNVGQAFQFAISPGSSASLPSGVTPSSYGNTQVYFVTSVPTPSTFTFSATNGGANITTSGSQTGIPVAMPVTSAQSVTLSGATVTWANHGLNIGDRVMLNAQGSSSPSAPGINCWPVQSYATLPFYVISAGFGTNSFQISTSSGGSALSYPTFNITGYNSGSGQFTIVGNTLVPFSFVNISGVGGLSGINGLQQVQNVNGNLVTFNNVTITGTYTSGGTVIPTTIGTFTASAVQTLNLNGTGDYPIYNNNAAVIADQTSFRPGIAQTLVFDTTFGGWLTGNFGNNTGPVGIQGGCPPEICIALCTAIGAHPHFVPPPLSLDPMTDWIPQLANLVKTTGPAWMVPRFEAAPNECWNSQFFGTQLAYRRPTILWPNQNNFFDFWNWKGKVISTVGQAVNAVYGGSPHTTTAYAVLSAVQTVSGTNASQNDPQMTSASYVAQSAAAQTLTIPSMSLTINFTKSAASNWTTDTMIANYWCTAERGTPTESVDAFNYLVTNAANPTAQAAIMTAMFGTSNTTTTVNGSPAFYANLQSVKANEAGIQTWGAGFGVTKICAYEGGYSPDYPASDFSSSISAITKATNAVVTLGGYNSDGVSPVGNPFVVGMPVMFSNVNGMTQLNNYNYKDVTITAGSPGNVNYNAHGFAAGQSVVFRLVDITGGSSILPAGLVAGQVYYVKTVVDANNFTVSATSGGTAINLATSQSGRIFCTACWVVTAVTTSSPYTIMISANSSSFTAYANDGSGQAYPGVSQYMLTMFRKASKFAPDIQQYALQSYTDFVSVGGHFPSMYMLSGTQIWSVYDPGIYSTPSPQWAAIQAFNA